MDPYLPDIIEDVVTRVSAITAILPDPFETFFDKGVYAAVSKSVYANPNRFPLVWFVMPFKVRRKDYNLHGHSSCDIIIAAPTKAEYTQAERDALTILKLRAVYETFIQEISNDSWFRIQYGIFPEHEYTIRPYWGGGDVNGGNNNNLFDKEIDAISISGLQLDIKRENCNTPAFIVNNN